jgi:hypothetical protein
MIEARIRFVVSGIPEDEFDRIRAAGRDDFGNLVTPHTIESGRPGCSFAMLSPRGESANVFHGQGRCWLPASCRTPSHRVGRDPVRRTPSHRVGRAPVLQMPSHRVGRAPVLRMPSHRVGQASVRRTPSHRVGQAPVRRTPSHRVGRAPEHQMP